MTPIDVFIENTHVGHRVSRSLTAEFARTQIRDTYNVFTSITTNEFLSTTTWPSYTLTRVEKLHINGITPLGRGNDDEIISECRSLPLTLPKLRIEKRKIVNRIIINVEKIYSTSSN